MAFTIQLPEAVGPEMHAGVLPARKDIPIFCSICRAQWEWLTHPKQRPPEIRAMVAELQDLPLVELDKHIPLAFTVHKISKEEAPHL